MHLWGQKTKSVPLSYEELKCQAITVPNLMTVDWWSELGDYLKQTGRQLFQLLLQLIPDLRQTLALFVLQFQFLRFARENLHSTGRKRRTRYTCVCSFVIFFRSHKALVCQHKVNITTPSLQRPAVLWGSPSPSLGFLFLSPPARSCGAGRGRHGLCLKEWARLGLRPPVWTVAQDPDLPNWTQSQPVKLVRSHEDSHSLL